MPFPPPIAPSLHWLRRYGAAVLRLIYPPQCLGCGASVTRPEVPLCALCVRLLERPDPEVVYDHIATLAQPLPLGKACSLWTFDTGGVVQRVQHRLKYGNCPAQGRTLGRWMQHLLPQTPDATAVVVPIPLHRTRLLERGYNQSDLLAEGLASACGLPYEPKALQRTRATASQTRLSREQRQRNVANAFTASDITRIAHRTVYLVDDVLTTGSTLVAAAEALLAADAQSVHAVTLAFARH